MSHKIVRKATEVLSNQLKYPAVVVAHAKVIVRWSLAKREAIQALRTKRAMWQFWLTSLNGKPDAMATRSALVALNKNFPASAVSQFVQAKSYLGATRTSMGLQLKVFESMVFLAENPDLSAALAYLENTNSREEPSSVKPDFMHWVNGNIAAEILAWRLVCNRLAKF